MKRYQKIILALFLMFLLIAAAVHLYAGFYLHDHLEGELQTRLNESPEYQYTLEIGDSGFNIFGRRLSFSDIRLSQKKHDDSEHLKAIIESLTISGIGFLRYLLTGELSLQHIEIEQPSVTVTITGETEESDESPDLQTLTARFSGKILQQLSGLTISQFSVRGLSAEISRTDMPDDTFISAGNSEIHLYDIAIDSTALHDDRVLPLNDISLRIKDVYVNSPDELYRFSAGSIDFSSTEDRFIISAVRMEPRIDRGAFSDRVGHEVDRITLLLDELRMSGIDTSRLNLAEGLFAELIVLDRVSMNVYRDKRPPFPANNRPPLPQQMIRNIPFPVMVDSISLVSGHIRYNERQPEANKPGYIDFANLEASMVNLTNIGERLSDGVMPVLHARSDIMHQGRLDVEFRFPMDAPEDVQLVNGYLDTMDLQALNVAFEPLAFARIDNGQILGMDFRMRLAEKRATGEVTLLYENLSISLLDKKNNEENLGSQIKTILANTFVIKSDNKGEDPRRGKINFERVERKSVFNYWWKSLLSGIKSNIGI